MSINTIKNFPLNATTYTAIVSDNAEFPTPFSWLLSTTADYLMASDAAGTDEANIPAGTTINQIVTPDKDGTVFFAKAVTGTPTMTLLTGLR